MHANNISVCVPDNGCNKKCPYCISMMTGKSSHDSKTWYRNIQKVGKLAEIAGVTSILITGKGEPILNEVHEESFICKVCNIFKGYPIELQTNGIYLAKELGKLPSLKGGASVSI